MSRAALLALALAVLPAYHSLAEAPASRQPTSGPMSALDVGDATLAAGGAGGLLRGGDGDRARAQEAAPHLEQRLVRTGHVGVVVDDFAPFHRELQAWLGEAGGHVADASLQHADGEVSWGSLTLRVPSDRLDGLVGWVEESVQVEQLSVQSRDVTAAWVDLEARIANSRLEESRLQALLAESTGSLADVLAVERELARVRGEIESAEGHMRVLRDQGGLSTLQLDVRVRAPYAAALAPTFGEDIAHTFSASVAALGATARGATLVGVAALPWVGPPGLFVLGLVGLARRRRGAAGAVG